ncbi:response regulator transcription factor [Candidatus Nomurabacteria bacterium]|nr:response regulator transcription factor [Candidatus Nomurabacteria bacterium]
MKKILIIEDDTFLQGLEAGKLTKSGFEVKTATTAEAGLKILDEETMDFLLLDLMLPGDKDGFAVLEEVRGKKDYKKTPIIIFSNLGEEAEIKKAKDLGANDFMIKSNFTLEELVEKINELLK